jgi:hypothetical protein
VARVSTIIQKFNAGELSPRMDGFIGFEKYPSGFRTLENLIPTPQGPVVRRPGTKFVAEVDDSTDRTALVSFEFSDVQAYAIEVGDLYFRFYYNSGAALEASKTITGATAADPCVLTVSGAHGWSNGDDIEIASVVGMTQLNNRRFRLANVTSSTAELKTLDGTDLNASGYTAYSSGGTASRVYTLTTTYAIADLFDADGRLRLTFSQSADVMYIAHPDYPVRKLSRTGHTSWTIADVDFTDGPYLDENTTAVTLGLSGTSGAGLTLTASAASAINDGDGFQTTDVGRLVRIGHAATSWAASTAYSVGAVRYNSGAVYICVTAGTSAASGGPTGTGTGIVDGTAQWDFQNSGGLAWGYGEITAHTSTTVVTITALRAFAATTAVTTWRLGAWSDTTGYPAAVGFHEERLFFGGAAFNPQRFDASKTNDFENFTPGVADDDPLSFSMASDQVNAIRWFSSARDLIVGTIGAEGRISAESANLPLTPTNVTVRWQTRHGCSILPPETIADAVIFLQRQGRKLREMAYTIEADGYRAPDLTILADHIMDGGVISMAYQREPWSALWCVRADGQLLALTYQRDEQVVAWSRHILGGVFGSGDAVVESVCSVPTSTHDQLWMVVKRTIGGRTVRYVEYMASQFGYSDAQEDAYFVDCGLTYDSASTSTVTGAWHLEGESVKILGDGAVQPAVTVASGSIALDSAASVVHAGYSKTWRAKPMRLEAGSRAGTAQGQMQIIDRIAIRFHRSLSCKVGRSETSGEFDEIAFRTGEDDLGAAPPLFTGDKNVAFPGGFDRDTPIIMFHDDPTPVTLVALVARVTTNEG